MPVPYGLTRGLPFLVLRDFDVGADDDGLWVDLAFDPARGMLDVEGLTFSAGPAGDGMPVFGVANEHTGVGCGVTYCGMSDRELVVGWQSAAAAELGLPEITVVELYRDATRLAELRAALRGVFDRDAPGRPRLNLDPEPAAGGEWLPLFDL
jgi:hypothetical protein